MADRGEGDARHPTASPIRRRGREVPPPADPGQVPGLVGKDAKQSMPRNRYRGVQSEKQLREGHAVEAAAIRDRALQLAADFSESFARDLEAQRARRRESREMLGKLLEDLSRAAERNRETYQHVVDHLPRFTNEELHGPTLSSHFFDGVENTIQHTDDIRGRLSTASSDLTGELQHALHEAKGVIDRLHGEIHSRDEVIASMRHSAAMSQRVVDELDARTSEAEKSTLEHLQAKTEAVQRSLLEQRAREDAQAEMERRVSILTERLQTTEANYKEKLAAEKDAHEATQNSLLTSRRELGLLRLRYGAVGSLAGVRQQQQQQAPATAAAAVAPDPEEVLPEKQLRQLRYEVEQLKRDLAAQHKARRKAEAGTKDAQQALRRYQLEHAPTAAKEEEAAEKEVEREEQEQKAVEVRVPAPTSPVQEVDHAAGKRHLDAIAAASAHLAEAQGADARGATGARGSPGGANSDRARQALHDACAQVALALDAAGAVLGVEAPHVAPTSLMQQLTAAWERVAATDAKRAVAVARSQRREEEGVTSLLLGDKKGDGKSDAVPVTEVASPVREEPVVEGDGKKAFDELLAALQQALSAARSSSPPDDVLQKCQRVETVASAHSGQHEGGEAPISSSDMASLLCGPTVVQTPPRPRQEVAVGMAPSAPTPRALSQDSTFPKPQFGSVERGAAPSEGEAPQQQREPMNSSPASFAVPQVVEEVSMPSASPPRDDARTDEPMSSPGSGSRGRSPAFSASPGAPTISPDEEPAASSPLAAAGMSAITAGLGSPVEREGVAASVGVQCPSPAVGGSGGGGSVASPPAGREENDDRQHGTSANHSGSEERPVAQLRRASEQEDLPVAAAGTQGGPIGDRAEHSPTRRRKAVELKLLARAESSPTMATANTHSPHPNAWLKGDGSNEAFVAATRLHVAGFWQHVSRVCRSIRGLTAAEGGHVSAAEVRTTLRDLTTASAPVLEAGHRRYLRLVQGWQAHCRSRGKRPEDLIAARVCPVCLADPGTSEPGAAPGALLSPKAVAQTPGGGRARDRSPACAQTGFKDQPRRSSPRPSRAADADTEVPDALQSPPFQSPLQAPKVQAWRREVHYIPGATLVKSSSRVLSEMGSSSSLPSIRRPGGVQLPPESQVRGRWPRRRPTDPMASLGQLPKGP